MQGFCVMCYILPGPVLYLDMSYAIFGCACLSAKAFTWPGV